MSAGIPFDFIAVSTSFLDGMQLRLAETDSHRTNWAHSSCEVEKWAAEAYKMHSRKYLLLFNSDVVAAPHLDWNVPRASPKDFSQKADSLRERVINAHKRTRHRAEVR